MELDFDAEYVDIDKFYEMLNKMSFEETINFLRYNSEHNPIHELDDGLIVYSTGGWSENEELIDMVNNPRNFKFYDKFIGYISGGHYYFHPTKKSYDFKLVLRED